MKVLIADDSQIMRKIIRANLAKLGIEKVFECADGASAGRMLAANTDTKILFTDLNMPNLNGYDLIKKIRSTPQLKDLEIIVISDKLDENAQKTLSVFGVTAYVPKPFNLTNFNETTLPIIEHIKNPRKKAEVDAKPRSNDIADLLAKEQPALKLSADGLTAMFNHYTIKVSLDAIVNNAEIMEREKIQVRLNILLAIAVLLFFGGCVHKGYLANEPILVNFTMKDYKIEDYGFLGADEKAAMLNVYHAGVLVLQIETDADTTCIDGKCLSSQAFVKDFICDSLPSDSLLYILNAKPIPTLTKMPNGFGFEQFDSTCNFKYRVQDESITAQTPNFLLSLQGTHDAN